MQAYFRALEERQHLRLDYRSEMQKGMGNIASLSFEAEQIKSAFIQFHQIPVSLLKHPPNRFAFAFSWRSVEELFLLNPSLNEDSDKEWPPI